MVDEQLKELGSVSVTPSFSAALVELVYNQVLSLGQDLESFSRHAKRKVIMPEDLYMVTRRNDMLTALLKEHLLGLEKGSEASGNKGKSAEEDDLLENDTAEKFNEQNVDDEEEEEDEEEEDPNDDLDEILDDAKADDRVTESIRPKAANERQRFKKDPKSRIKVKTEIKEENDPDQTRLFANDSFDDIDDEELVNLT
ncbi:BA75_00150T0 [Komagataella pastoris]|uniref:BA75_00150T0 n=1 Tax=Komagataella pastoris TaxID=4922 RepID=A0A1B2J7D9_PICPA|nr:BA75_00150T0 [Komagataella pastoris]